MKKATLIFVFAVCVACIRAEDSKPARWRGPEVQSVTLALPVPDTIQKIFSNLGPPNKAYSNGGFEILGPHSSAGFSQFISLPLTPTANAHVYQVRAAIQYLSAGTANQVNISLYSDNAGIPGTLLAGPVTVSNLSRTGCCQLAIANFPSGLAVIAGTQYWIVADTPAAEPGATSREFGTMFRQPRNLRRKTKMAAGFRSRQVWTTRRLRYTALSHNNAP